MSPCAWLQLCRTGRSASSLDQDNGMIRMVRSPWLLILFCPADSREGYFKGMADLTKNGREPTKDELIALMEQYDQYPVPDPSHR